MYNLEELLQEKEHLEGLNAILKEQIKRLEDTVENQKAIIRVLVKKNGKTEEEE